MGVALLDYALYVVLRIIAEAKQLGQRRFHAFDLREEIVEHCANQAGGFAAVSRMPQGELKVSNHRDGRCPVQSHFQAGMLSNQSIEGFGEEPFAVHGFLLVRLRLGCLGLLLNTTRSRLPIALASRSSASASFTIGPFSIWA
jgi:hypothetical protein